MAFSIEFVGYPDEIEEYLAKREGDIRPTSDRLHAGIAIEA